MSLEGDEGARVDLRTTEETPQWLFVTACAALARKVLKDVSEVMAMGRWFGLSVLATAVGSLTIACSTPTTTTRARIQTPTSAAKVTSSASTLKLTNIKTWQVYRGYGQTVALGFDRNGKPVDGCLLYTSPSPRDS